MSRTARFQLGVRRVRGAVGSSVGRLRLVYFLYWAAAGTSVPFLAKYLVGRGFTGAQIGSIQMLPSLLAPFVAMAWARVAERSGDPVRVLRWITAWAALSACLLPFAATPLLVGAVIFSQSLGDRAIVPLLDAVSLEHCRTHPADSYARIRMFGSIGFFVLAYGLGLVLTWRGNRPGDPVVPAVVAAFAACYALAARRLAPAPSAHAQRPGLSDLGGLLRDRQLMLLLGVCALHWAACVPYTQFLAVFVDGLGLPPRVAGAGILVAVLAEIGAMMTFPALERRWAPRTLLAVAFLASALRWGLLSVSTSAAAVIALQALHGLTYGVYWSALMKLVAALVPPRVRATGLALTAALTGGAGTALGAKLTGLGYDLYGSVAPVFRWSAAADLALVAVVLVVLARQPRAAPGGAAAG